MTVRVATVLSAREWEPRLVAHANESASLRIVLRAFQPRDIETHAGDIDVVVAGGEVAWVTPHQIASWKRLGFGVVGIHPPGDAPAASLLELGGANEVVPDDIEIAALVQAIRFVGPALTNEPHGRLGTVIGVIGTRGAPGCTEVACAFARVQSKNHRTVLIDADLSAPALAVRLGVAPRPDITDAADMVRAEGSFDSSCFRRIGDLDVITGSHREGEAPVRAAMLSGLIEVAATCYEQVVLDVGSANHGDQLRERLDRVVLVVDGSPLGIVRAAQAVHHWFGPPPTIVVNKIPSRAKDEVVVAVRRWTGLDPAVVIPDRPRVRRHATSGKLPERSFQRAVSRIGA